MELLLNTLSKDQGEPREGDQVDSALASSFAYYPSKGGVRKLSLWV